MAASIVAASLMLPVAPATAAGASADCAVSAATPFQGSSGKVYATGYVDCSQWHDLHIAVTIRIGTVIYGRTDSYSPAPSISDTAAHEDIVGNQQWCTYVSGWADGQLIGGDSTCESAGF